MTEYFMFCDDCGALVRGVGEGERCEVECFCNEEEE